MLHIIWLKERASIAIVLKYFLLAGRLLTRKSMWHNATVYSSQILTASWATAQTETNRHPSHPRHVVIAQIPKLMTRVK